jgi:hypothetical protein
MARCGFDILMRWILFLTLFTAFVLSAMSSASCSFMSFATIQASAEETFDFTDSEMASGAEMEPGDGYDMADPNYGKDSASGNVDGNINESVPQDYDQQGDQEGGNDGQIATVTKGDGQTSSNVNTGNSGANADGEGGTRSRMLQLPCMTAGQYETGLFRYPDPDEGVCTNYPSDKIFDNGERVARFGAAVAALCAAVAIFFLLVDSLFCSVLVTKWFVTLLLVVATICQALTYLMLSSYDFCSINSVADFYYEVRDKSPCVVSAGGVYAAFACLGFFLSLAINFCAPQPEPVCCKKGGGSGGSGRGVVAYGSEEERRSWTTGTYS